MEFFTCEYRTAHNTDVSTISKHHYREIKITGRMIGSKGKPNVVLENQLLLSRCLFFCYFFLLFNNVTSHRKLNYPPHSAHNLFSIKKTLLFSVKSFSLFAFKSSLFLYYKKKHQIICIEKVSYIFFPGGNSFHARIHFFCK